MYPSVAPPSTTKSTPCEILDGASPATGEHLAHICSDHRQPRSERDRPTLYVSVMAHFVTRSFRSSGVVGDAPGGFDPDVRALQTHLRQASKEHTRLTVNLHDAERVQ
jgi:hypothetical protein